MLEFTFPNLSKCHVQNEQNKLTDNEDFISLDILYAHDIGTF